jgi:dTDP-4-amino-4,6-dideoxygalactose transaminase
MIPIAQPTIDDDEIAAVAACLKSLQLATGPKVREFEEALSRRCAGRHVICVTSGTAALHLALLGFDLKPGDEVITSPLTFIATANTIVQAGARPVFVDVDPTSLNIDPVQVRGAVSSRTKALLPVHFAGLPADLAPLYEVAERNGLRVLEDAAQAFGARYNGEEIGSFGDCQIFSFHPNKTITSGEGGCVVTRDDHMLQFVKRMRFHGIDERAANPRNNLPYDVREAGYKYNMPDICAAVGLAQLKKCEDLLKRREVIAQTYLSCLSGMKRIQLTSPPAFQHRHAWNMFAAVLAEPLASDRDTIVRKLHERGVRAGTHYPAAHLFSFYRQQYNYCEGMFPQAERIASRIVTLPIYPTMTDEAVQRVAETFQSIIAAM